MTDYEGEAWKLIIMYAESGLEDDIDEDGDFSEKDYERITARAWAILRSLPPSSTGGTPTPGAIEMAQQTVQRIRQEQRCRMGAWLSVEEKHQLDEALALLEQAGDAR